MLSFDVLQSKKDLLIEKKNNLLKEKWKIDGEIEQLERNRVSYFRQGDFISISKFKSTESRIKFESRELKNQIRELTNQITKLDGQLKEKEFEKINEDYISNKKLSKKDIERKIDQSKSISQSFDALIKEYSLFLRNVDSHLKKSGSDLWVDDLNHFKTDLENKIHELIGYNDQLKDFKQFDMLISVIEDGETNLKIIKSNFKDCKDLTDRFKLVIDDCNNFIKYIDYKFQINEKYCDDDVKLMKIKLEYEILFLMKNQKYCFNFNKLDKLNGILDNTVKELKNMKSLFTVARNILIKFDAVIEKYTGFSAKLDSQISMIEKEYDCDDLRQMSSQIESQKKNLLNHFMKYFDFMELDELMDEIKVKKRYLNDMELKLHNFQSISDKFNLIIEDFSKFLDRIDADFEKLNGEYPDENLMLIIKEAEIKKEKLLKYKFNSYLFQCSNNLINMHITYYNDLNKIKNDFHDWLLSEADQLIQSKSDICLKLRSKITEMMYNSKEYMDSADKKEFLNSLNNIKNELLDLSEKIKNDLDKIKGMRVHEDNYFPYLTIINNLNQISFDDLENSISNQEKIYKMLLIQHDNIGDNIKILHNFEKDFNNPLFKHQLKKYNLSNDELEMIKNKIIDDIVNNVISDEGADFKKIIKKRCMEFRKNHIDFDETKIEELMSMDSFSDVDGEIRLECINLVKKDIIKGNIKPNNAKLKFKIYVDKKVQEINQINELERIKNNPDIPAIKIHLSFEENEEIYEKVKNEICSKNGIRGNVKSRVYFWTNEKIRDNQSKARGELNVVKRNLSSLTDLNVSKQNEFVEKIELLISKNEIKMNQITEENIVKLSEDFLNGKL